jgi:hypothetical protein
LPLILAERPANGGLLQISHRSPGSDFGHSQSETADSLRRTFEKFPFLGDCGRAPGAPAIEALREQQLKVEYFASAYSRMHRGIVPHPTHIDAKNVDDLNGMSFVFLCMEGGTAKRAIVDKLEALGVPFVDVGMGLYAKRNSIGGMLRSVISMPDARGPARARISFAADDENNEYDKNIQVADLNALNACLAVISWKKSRAFYFGLGKERFVSYTIANSLLAKGDLR